MQVKFINPKKSAHFLGLGLKLMSDFFVVGDIFRFLGTFSHYFF